MSVVWVGALVVVWVAGAVACDGLGVRRVHAAMVQAIGAPMGAEGAAPLDDELVGVVTLAVVGNCAAGVLTPVEITSTCIDFALATATFGAAEGSCTGTVLGTAADATG